MENKMTRSSKFTQITIGAVAALTLSTATQGIAQSGAISWRHTDPVTLVQFLEDKGASERINFSGKLRMLSQRLPAAACNNHAGIAPEQSEAILHAAKVEFDTIIEALEFGNADLNIIGEEARRKTLAAIANLHAAYDPFHATFDNIEKTGGSDTEVKELAEHNIAILNAAKLLVSEISGQYADPTALLQSDALTIDIAGRQRMLTQMISKEVCLISSGIYAEQSMATIGNTVNMFEVSLNALMFGMEGAGIAPAPTGEILAGLETDQADWTEIKGCVEAVSSGEPIDDATRALVFIGLNKTMANMNAVVGLYAEDSKLGL
jgi:hypothetical protein